MPLEHSRNPPWTRDIVEYLEGLKEHVENFCGRHRAQEVTTGFLGKTIVGGLSVMCLSGVTVVPRCLVRYRSAGRDGRGWGWGDGTVWCRVQIED